jgi:hypothetical protein
MFIPTGAFKITSYWTGSALADVQTSLGVTMDGGFTDTDVTDTALAIIDAQRQAVSSDYTCTKYRVTQGDDGGPPYLFLDTSVAIFGLVSGSAAQPASALRFDLHTSTPGRTGVGHFYLPPCGDGDIENDGGLSSTQNTRCVAVTDDLMAILTGGIAVTAFNVFHPVDAPNTIPSVVISMSHYGRISTQVRRRNRRL